MKVGSYILKKLLGEGAFGRVYAGEHAILGSAVPVCIKQEKTREDPYMGMFRDEAEVVAKLRHPSLPTFLDYLEEPGDVGQLLVISFIHGTPMDKLVTAQDFIDDEHLCWVIDRHLGALSYLHGRWEMVHCDLKPANSVLDIEDHNVTLVDFGMATLEPDDKTRAKGGTPGYIPPEFALGYPPIPASDIYSVGKIGIALAGGNVGSGEPPADMNRHLADFLVSLIRRDPVERPQNVDDLRDDLEKVRRRAFGRVTCDEMFKYRDGRTL
jgi:eukaryotic-like serine/threonine-protein kinase